MEIKVRVFLNNAKEREEKKEFKSVILTPEYVKKLNKQIEYNTLARKINNTTDTLTLKRIIR